MRIAARFFSRFIITFVLFIFLLPTFSTIASAQTIQPYYQNTHALSRANVEDNVPQNQHTYVQAMFIELLMAMECQLTGIDLANPGQSCLGVNTATGELGYAPTQNGTPPIGGIIGMLNSGIGSTLTPAYSTKDYVHYLADSFGIKKTYAAPATAFDGLTPVLGLWRMVRDIAYFLLTIAFIFIGIGVMLRLHIDPRTVMTVQNQIPRVIICIILITFSYAFAALMADTMWVVTYMGINKLTQQFNPASYHVCGNTSPMSLSQYATTQIIETPFVFVDDIFATKDCAGHHSGILETGWTVALNLSSIEWNLFMQIVGIDPTHDCTQGGVIAAIATPLFLPFALPIAAADFFFNGGGTIKSLAACLIGKGFGAIFQFFANIAWFFIVTIIIIVSLFRIWFELLKAYIMLLIYIVVAPLWIVFGLLPKKPLGFEKWLRAYFAHLAVFPATVFLLITARLFYQLFNAHVDTVFVPPLVGNPYAGNFGAILEFGMLIMTPHLLSIIRDKLGTPPLKQAAAIGQAFSAGRQAVGAVPRRVFEGLNRRNPSTGAAEGPLARMRDQGLANLKTRAFQQGGWFNNNSSGQQNFLQRVARRSAERSQNFADHGVRRTHDELYRNSPRQHPNNQAAVAQVDAAMARRPRDRSVADEELLRRNSHLLSDDQRAQRAAERMTLEVRVTGPNGNTSTHQLSGPQGQTQTSAFALGQINTSTPGGQAAAARIASERASNADEHSHWNKNMEDLSPIERARLQDFLTTNSQHMNNQP